MQKPSRLIQVKKNVLVLTAAILLICSPVFGQRKLQNQPKYDTKRVHFGFSIGFNFYDFHIQEVENLGAITGYYSIKTTVSPGYNINIISNLRLTKYLDMRFNPGFASTNRKIDFDLINPLSREREIVTKEITSSSIEFPLEFKYRSKRINNYGLYVLGGVKYNKDLASKENVLDDQVFKIKSNDLFYEFGFGVDIYFEFFKFSPQVKASWGYANLLVQDGTFFVEGIHRLESRSILLNLTFE